MKLLETATGKSREAVIETMKSKDFQVIKNSERGFNKFEWSEYKGKEVFKIRLVDDEAILGLMYLIDHEDETTNAIEIALLQVSDENVGRNKKFENIGGCLIAYAARESFKRGHDGFIFLIPKTDLIEHYSSKYGFQHMPLRTLSRPEGLMILYDGGSRRLIQKYLDEASHRGVY
jgi:hypothetical protein